MLARINFQALPVLDQQRALEFYRDILGMVVQTDGPDGIGGRWIAMEIKGADTRLHLPLTDALPPSNAPSLYLVCDDVDAEVQRLAGLGIKMDDGPAPAPWAATVRYAMFRDSEGHLILIQSSTSER
jgi:catechol 2,3-dioxygenase-like lactoylglutathione lyase family enzyme